METVLRVAAIYFFIMISLRLLGKREFSQLTPFELVTLLLIPEISAQAMLREDFSLTNAVVGLSTLFLLVFLTSNVTHLSRRAERVIGGQATVLVCRGAFVPEHMNRERITPDEVYAEMHRSGLARLDQIQWAILESDGKLSFIPVERGTQITRDDESMA